LLAKLANECNESMDGVRMRIITNEILRLIYGKKVADQDCPFPEKEFNPDPMPF
jgi:hypothetical protein